MATSSIVNAGPTVPLQVLAGVAEAVQWLQTHGVRDIQCDSRRVRSGDAFIAWPGFATDGRRFVISALETGASACLVEADGLSSGGWAFSWPTDRVAAVSGLKAVTGPLAAAFYRHPSRDVQVVAVTGTNGKTSTAWWLAQALAAADCPCGVMGTLGVGLPGPAADPLRDMQATGLTTPDPVAVQRALRGWADAGVRTAALEASSIGLVEQRLAGTSLAVAVFTNFTQDHLDYHGSMAEYWAAKRALFDWPGLQAAVVNIDDAHGQTLAEELAQQSPPLSLWTVSLRSGQGARLSCVQWQVTAGGMRMVVEEEGSGSVTLEAPLIGDHNVANVLGVMAALRALGVRLTEAARACAQLGAVPGRMDQVNGLLDAAGVDLPLVVVDYAHTPDAVDKALHALRPVAVARGGQLHCIVGCGGDRDAAKRPLMAALAEAGADGLCLTSDNPRSEDPDAILAQMVAGLRQPERALVVPDRAQAIASRVAQAAVADVVLIAGKGHETTQEVAGVKHPFSDQAHALAALQARCVAPPSLSHALYTGSVEPSA